MRILHLSHTGLPDLRIEKSALTMKKEGHELIFMGGRPAKWQNLEAFDRTFHAPLGNNLEATLSGRVRKKWLGKIDQIAPDIVHSHNVWVTRYLTDTEYPVIYDDHEYWSKQMQGLKVEPKIQILTLQPARLLIPRWEQRILERFPTPPQHIESGAKGLV
ncbi:MAG: hypothetical protein ACXADF_15885 [Candidatus Thorarchaeota archaeon]|jgi:hypothetical protein